MEGVRLEGQAGPVQTERRDAPELSAGLGAGVWEGGTATQKRMIQRNADGSFHVAWKMITDYRLAPTFLDATGEWSVNGRRYQLMIREANVPSWVGKTLQYEFKFGTSSEFSYRMTEGGEPAGPQITERRASMFDPELIASFEFPKVFSVNPLDQN